jgi:hypothetical protein
MYDDGLSCPGGCDAHVVFSNSMNGTQFAHAPDSTPGHYGKCTVGQTCLVCLEAGDNQCLPVVYRGGGPPVGTFDFTPRFYQQACPTAPAGTMLSAKCVELKAAAKALESRVNCILEPTAPPCVAMMKAAAELRSLDQPKFQACRTQGQATYNKGKAPADKRSDECAYESVGTGGPNSRGVRWRKLLPAACREGTFVGRDGTDCCSGVLFADGPLGRECSAFYPAPKP